MLVCTLDGPSWDRWVEAAALVASRDHELFTQVIERARATAHATANAVMTEPVSNNAKHTSADDDPFGTALTARYSDGVQMLLVWHAAKQVQALVYEITNELDPMRRQRVSLKKHLERAQRIQRWANAMVEYCAATEIEVTPIMAGDKEKIERP